MTSDRMMDALLEGFNPEGDPSDRRLLYEVAGLRLNEDEFCDQDSVEFIDEVLAEQNACPVDHAFEYGGALVDEYQTSLDTGGGGGVSEVGLLNDSHRDQP